jgi:tungstate transport system permease protein
MINSISQFFSNYSDIFAVVLMSIFVSISSTLIAGTVGFMIGIPCALKNFRGKKLIMRVTNTLMSLPPVLMGLVVYLLLSKEGPFGRYELLFTPAAMIIAQSLLVLPIVFGLTVSSVSKTGKDVEKACIALGAGKKDTFITIIKESKVQLFSVITAGFGRAISEVGAVMMVGGNIKGHTRVMTTYIALETGKGNFNEAITIGVILLVISFIINSALYKFQRRE